MPPKRMTANPAKPLRYRPGKPIAPEESDSEESEDSEAEGSEEDPRQPSKKAAAEAPAKVSTALRKVDLSKRFEEGRKEEEQRAAEEARKRAEEESSEYSTANEDEEEEEEEEESEEEEEEVPKRVLLRPTFIPKGKRGVVASPSLDPEVEAKKKAEEEARKKAEAAALLEEHIRRDAAAKAAGRKGWDDDEDDGEGLDDTDDLDPTAERAAWKLRELVRVKREREELEKIEKEREEIERRRAMDPELRKKEDMEYVKKQREEKMENRGKMGFMQKYYHKGAFYQDDSEILKKDYATTAVEDEVKNRDVLPKYMQVRGDEVGKRGRTRWTHLTAEDTSMQNGGSPWFDKNGINKRASGKLGGMQDDERFQPDDRKDRSGDGDHRERAPKGRDDRDRDPRDRRPPGGPRGSRGSDSGGGRYQDRYVPGAGGSHRDRSRSPYDRDRRDHGRYNREWSEERHDRDHDRGRGRERGRERGRDRNGDGDTDRDRKRPYSPPRQRGDDDGEKRRRTEAR
ncbi:putative microfibrillar-associated protein family protein [Tuber indicum]|nr:putative microfibrillar-associated protein family protein [Tuber indicum]